MGGATSRPAGPAQCSARAALERRTIHIPDVMADPEYTYGVGFRGVEPFRTTLAVPILKGNDLLGVLIVYHLEVRPLTDNQIALVETFADQAVIAIENARLFNELRDALQQQTGELKALTEAKGEKWSPRWVADDRIVYVSGGLARLRWRD